MRPATMTMTSTFRPAVVLSLGRVLGAAAAFLVPLVLVRLLSQGEFGTYKQIFLLYATLYGIAQVGIAESLYYFIPSDPGNAGRYATNALLMLIIVGAVCALTLTVAAGSVAHWMNNSDLAPLLPLLGIFLGLMLATAVLEPALTSASRIGFTATSYAASDVLRAALCLLPLLIAPDLRGFLYGSILFAALRLTTTWVLLRQTLPGRAVFDGALLRRQLAYALPFAMAIVLYALQENLHQYVVASQVDAATFAIYAVGCLTVPFVDTLYTSASSVMMVRMTACRGTSDPSVVGSIWRDATLKLALIFFPLAGFLIVSGTEVIQLLFTSAYLASVPLFRLWVVLIALSCIPVDAALRVFADTRFLMLLYGMRLVIVAAAIYPALAVFGLQGAMLVAITSAAFGKTLGLVRLRGLLRVTGRRLMPWRDLAEIVFCTAVAMAVAQVAGGGITGGPVLLLATRALVFGAVLGVLLAVSGKLSRSVRPVRPAPDAELTSIAAERG